MFTNNLNIYNCAVLIPTHSPECSSDELKSLINTFKVLKKRRIFVLLPKGVCSRYFKEVAKQYENVSVINLQQGFLGSIENYNRMALSTAFYNLFRDYEYMLICHLDAWIFKDDIDKWTKAGYDYVGAPLFLPELGQTLDLWKLSAPVGGNGGLCLRKREKISQALESTQKKINYILFLRGCYFLISNKRYDMLKIYLQMCKCIKSDLISYQNKYNVYEDVTLSILMPLLKKNINVAPPHIAARFALEVNAEEIINTKLKLDLPLGIHGIGKYFSQFTVDQLSAKQKMMDENIQASISTYKNDNFLKPVVSVVTIIKNIFQSCRQNMLKQCIESVQAQSYENIEHIIIDGASSDGTLEFLNNYKNISNIKIYSSEDQGIWDAMQKGLLHSKGRYVNFLNSDDYFCDTNAVSIAVNSLLKNSADWFYSGAEIIRKDGSKYTFPTSLYGVFSCMGIVHQTMFVERDVLLKTGAFTSIYKTKENYLMMLLIINGFKVASSPLALVHYREGGYSYNEYGGDRLEETKKDFSDYFYNLAGKRWGLTNEECYQMFGWQVFANKGLVFAIKLGCKLRMIGLRIDFLRKFIEYTFNNNTKVQIINRAINYFLSLDFYPKKRLL